MLAKKSCVSCFIASASDIDDLVPILTAYQLEWNKLRERLLSTRISDVSDDVALAAIDAGAEDVDTSDVEVVEVYTTPGGLEQVRKALGSAGVPVDSAENTMIAKNTVEVDEHRARQNLRLVEMLEDLDDVQRVTANFDIPEDVLQAVYA